jgi:hypothetical protein
VRLDLRDDPRRAAPPAGPRDEGPRLHRLGDLRQVAAVGPALLVLLDRHRGSRSTVQEKLLVIRRPEAEAARLERLHGEPGAVDRPRGRFGRVLTIVPVSGRVL